MPTLPTARRPFCHAVLLMHGSTLGTADATAYACALFQKRSNMLTGLGVAEPTMSASMSADARFLQTYTVVPAPARALSRTGSFHPGRTKWHVYPFGMRSR
jgi:hypothetical protein